MPRFTVGWRTAGAGSTTLPIASLFATANTPLWLVECGVTNTTVTALSMALRRATAAGTAGTARTVNSEENDTATARGNPVDTHTVAPTLTADSIRNASIGASIGSGVIFTFGGRGLYIPPGTANGVCLIPLTGTGQICDVYFSWDS